MINDGTIRIQSSINLNHLQEISKSTDYIKIQSRANELEKVILPFYDSKQIKRLSADFKISTQLMKSQMLDITNNSWTTQAKELQYIINDLCNHMIRIYINRDLENISNSMKKIGQMFGKYDILYIPHSDSNKENTEDEKVNTEIVSEIYNSDHEKRKNSKESAIITLSPINDKVLKYLSENPEALYQLTSRRFEEVMAEIYLKLGYKVELTKPTRDGGKDLIIRKPGILGDFIYYVECKKYSANNPVGVGIVRDLVGVINMDRVNAGIIATTSYFAKDARNLILDNNLSFQIKMHDYNKIKELLKHTV